MNIETLELASSLHIQMEDVQDQIEYLRAGGCFDIKGLNADIKLGFADPLRERLRKVVLTILENHVSELQKQFDEL